MDASTTALDAKFGYLDALPIDLVAPTTEISAGTFEERVRCLTAWRESLLLGRMPSPDVASWQQRPLVDSALEELSQLALPRYCAGIPELADAVLLSILQAWNLGETRVRERRYSELREIQRALANFAKERERLRGKRSVRNLEPSHEEDAPPFTADLHKQLLLQLETELAKLARSTVREELSSSWAELVAAFAELEAAFGALGTLLGLGWDLSRGIVRSTGWNEIEKIRRLLTSLPELREIIKTLGRIQANEEDSAQPILEQILEPLRRGREEWLDIRLPDIPHDTRGLVRSGSIERMIPAEAALLAHPKLRLLWHSRRAERSLLGYRVEGVHAERVDFEDDGKIERLVEKPPMIRGPMLICLDTSGSMSGLPERVAKALVLETMRVAHAERRACYLYAFSGPGDVREMELSLDPQGIAALLDFLQASFHGGTDVSGPLRRALAKLEDGNWRRADCLLVTDGEFPTDNGLEIEALDARTNRGVRIHGVLIGSHESAAMRNLCEPLHAFASWNALGRLEETR